MLLVALVAFLVGAYARPFVATDPLQFQGGLLQAGNSAAGRFNLIVSPLEKKEKFLLDSQTGKIWQLVKAGEATDKPFVCHTLSVIDDTAHPSIINKTKLSYKIPSLNTVQVKALKDRLSLGQPVVDKVSSEKTTVEFITNGKVSKKVVPKDSTTKVKTVSDEIPNEKAFRINTVSVKTANQTDL